MATSKIVEDVVSEVAGPDVVPLVRALKDKANVSEFKLADSIKREINLTRNMLYRLYDHNLVSFIRKKDKKKGWYIYYWTFNEKRINDLAADLRKNRLERLHERLNREKTTQFYMCENNCMRLDFEQSHDFQFKCPECGSLMNIEDNTQKIAQIEAEIKALESMVAQKPKARPKAKVQVPKTKAKTKTVKPKAKPVKTKKKVKKKK